MLSPDARTLVFVGYTTEGYDLFSLDWQLALVALAIVPIIAVYWRVQGGVAYRVGFW